MPVDVLGGVLHDAGELVLSGVLLYLVLVLGHLLDHYRLLSYLDGSVVLNDLLVDEVLVGNCRTACCSAASTASS